MKHVRFLEVASALHPRRSVVKAMALLWTRDGKGVTAIAGYVGAATVWDAIDALSGILEKSDIQAVWSAVYDVDWNCTVHDGEFLNRFPTPFTLCFEHIVQQLWQWAKRKAGGELVVPMFAYQPEYADHMREVGAAYGQFPWYRDVLGPLAFDYPSRTIPLQAADLLAHEISWEWDRVEYGPPPTPMNIGIRRVLERSTGFNGLHVGGCFDANALKLTVDRFKKTGSVL